MWPTGALNRPTGCPLRRDPQGQARLDPGSRGGRGGGPGPPGPTALSRGHLGFSAAKLARSDGGLMGWRLRLRVMVPYSRQEMLSLGSPRFCPCRSCALKAGTPDPGSRLCRRNTRSRLGSAARPGSRRGWCSAVLSPAGKAARAGPAVAGVAEVKGCPGCEERQREAPGGACGLVVFGWKGRGQQ